MTAVAGNSVDDEFCGFHIEDDAEDAEVEPYNSVFTVGINSYAEPNDIGQYPKGADTSVSVIDGNTYTLEASFPWDAIEGSVEEIMANGGFGFGIAVNDADEGPSRTTQMMWASEQADFVDAVRCVSKPSSYRLTAAAHLAILTATAS